jgi:hypothetical protein
LPFTCASETGTVSAGSRQVISCARPMRAGRPLVRTALSVSVSSVALRWRSHPPRTPCRGQVARCQLIRPPCCNGQTPGNRGGLDTTLRRHSLAPAACSVRLPDLQALTFVTRNNDLRRTGAAHVHDFLISSVGVGSVCRSALACSNGFRPSTPKRTGLCGR